MSSHFRSDNIDNWFHKSVCHCQHYRPAHHPCCGLSGGREMWQVSGLWTLILSRQQLQKSSFPNQKLFQLVTADSRAAISICGWLCDLACLWSLGTSKEWAPCDARKICSIELPRSAGNGWNLGQSRRNSDSRLAIKRQPRCSSGNSFAPIRNGSFTRFKSRREAKWNDQF